ncbi:hypothetical protein FSP39_018577 [Pinctada imbricata]|uniref:Phospholipid/glycerol acyltransferase domain-containing protein n=1 Tax=Pinctada imbricata TaxID=66713 RepID=A0AA89C1Y8_PINIB|nr:hypothetical protein FSP39_018577 [Pinctada imbricata]
MGLTSDIKSWSIWFVLFTYIYFVSTLIVNFLQLCSLIIWPFDKTLYRKVNYNLAYLSWCQYTSLGQWWSNSECYLHVDPDERKHFAKESIIVVMNHKYEIDWLMAWVLSERYGLLGGTKIYGKKVLGLIPLIGWAWYFTESLFLHRDWQKDRAVIAQGVKNVTEYPDGYFVVMLLFPEGTRLTDEKLKNSQKIAQEKGYPIMKHHLLPRAKGFVLSVQELKKLPEHKLTAIYDITTVFENGNPPLMDAIRGKKQICRMRLRRFPVANLPDSEEELSDWLRNLFKEKDEIVDKFLKTGEMELVPYKVPKRAYDLIVHMMWAALTLPPLFYYVTCTLLFGSFLQKFVIVIIFAIVMLLAKFMIGYTEIKKGSSYGKEIRRSEKKTS